MNRANTLRLRQEFDLASNAYQTLINTEKNDPESYWGLLLCKYGIEYVEDKKTNTRIPTCHRTTFKSILVIINIKFKLVNKKEKCELIHFSF